MKYFCLKIIEVVSARHAEKRKSSEMTENNKSMDDSGSVETQSVSSSRSGYSQSKGSSASPTCSPPRKIKAFTGKKKSSS